MIPSPESLQVVIAMSGNHPFEQRAVCLDQPSVVESTFLVEGELNL